MEETRKVIGDRRASVFGQCFGKPTAIARGRLDVAYVRDRQVFRSFPIVEHPIEYEPMEPIACPSIPDTQSLENHKRFAQSDRQFDRTLKGEIRREPSVGRHPVQHILTVGAQVALGRGSNADRRCVEGNHRGKHPVVFDSRSRGFHATWHPVHSTQRATGTQDLGCRMFAGGFVYPWGSVIENGSRALASNSWSSMFCSMHNSRMVLPEANASLVSLAAFSYPM